MPQSGLSLQRLWRPPEFEVVALAASAGGLEALSRVLADLPGDFPAPVLVVRHLAEGQPSYLPDILARRTRLRVKRAEAGDRVRPGVVYVAPPGRHLAAGPDRAVVLADGPKVQFCRPAADVLFGSVASAYGPRAVAGVLTGMGRDGADGVRAVRRAGGFVIAQDPATAAHPGMPEAVIQTRQVDLVLPAGRLGFALVALVMGGDAARRLPAPGPVGRRARPGGLLLGRVPVA